MHTTLDKIRGLVRCWQEREEPGCLSKMEGSLSQIAAMLEEVEAKKHEFAAVMFRELCLAAESGADGSGEALARALNWLPEMTTCVGGREVAVEVYLEGQSPPPKTVDMTIAVCMRLPPRVTINTGF